MPDWLAEVVRPQPAPPPWPEMIRAALAICVPLAAAFAVGRARLGVLPATGALLGTMSDTGGPYLSRVKRVSSAAVFGGAAGLAIGSAIHGHGWLAVLALTVVAGVSGVLSALGDIGSVTGLQLLVYASLGIGPLGAQRPVWHTVVGFLAGTAWALVLILPGWLLSPHGKEQRDVAAVYLAAAAALQAIGTDALTSRFQAGTAALNTAYGELLSTRSTAPGRNRRMMRLIAALNASYLIGEATVALGVAGTRPPPMVIATVERLADSIRGGTPPPMIPPPWSDTPGALALRDAMAGAARVLSMDWSPEHRTREGLADQDSGAGFGWRLGEAFGRLVGELETGPVGRRFTIRLMVCIGLAGVVTEVLPLQRSYWVPLTVALVLKPDYGSVFARALQRSIGTIVGAVAGAVLLVLVHGAWLLVPFGVLAALLPYGRKRNFGLLATFLTPLVVVLIDLLSPLGWRLARDRLIDTLVGCGIALLVGFAAWPMTWYSHLPGQFALAVRDVCDYMETALIGGLGSAADVTSLPAVSRMERSTYRALSDLRVEFQRTMSEPPSISRRAAAWWPAVVGLEQVMYAAEATALAVSRGGASRGGQGPPPQAARAAASSPRAMPSRGGLGGSSPRASTVPPPSLEAVRQLTVALRSAGDAAAAGRSVQAGVELPDDETLKPVTEAVRALLGVLGSGKRL